MHDKGVQADRPQPREARQASIGNTIDNTIDYRRHLARHDQGYYSAIQQIQQLVDQGLQSGTPEEFDFEAFLERKQ